MSNFFAEQDIKPLKLPTSTLFTSTDQLYEIQKYINETIGAYINRHKNALVQLYSDRDRLISENEKLKRNIEQMSKVIEQLQKDLKTKANAPVFLTR